MQSIKVAKKRGLASMMKPTERATIARYARRRFRNLVRLAFLNEYWIEPDGDDNELGDNVVKNVRMLTQGKKQKKAALTLRAKSIMNKKKENRTDEENLLIYKAVGNMKCFRKYPQHVKEQLSACTYFVYYAPGRVIVRQDDEGSSLFFILEGEVQVTQTRWDQALSEHTVVFSGVMESGAMFGEVSLLHGIKRLATVTAKEHCELLMIKKEDFDIVLKATVIDEWNAILEMMSKFTYFETWDDMLKRECCIMAKKGFFKYEDVILGEGIGEDKFVYFMVKGTCDIIEYIKIQLERKGNFKKYKLCPTRTQQEEDQAAYLNLKAQERTRRSTAFSSAGDKYTEPTKGLSDKNEQNWEKTLRNNDVLKKNKKGLIETTTTTEPHFIRICNLRPLACFNLGENLKNRYVVAMEDVEMLMIPRVWLMQRNRPLWANIIQFLNKEIPSSTDIFHEYVERRRWESYKTKTVKDLLRTVHTGNNIHNVPISIRMKNDTKFYLEYYHTHNKDILKKD